ncbi:MAG: MerR family transcriptional regulator [Ktedonobacteraceae bacterium]|nr:MerR family transcriptional regulator [Ktedonobacteraceae bacterium]
MTAREGSIEWPDLELFSDTPVFNTKAVVQQTGITAPTLRAWERRYDLLSPERANNDYRLYSARDIALIRWLKARINAGMSISQAISLFHHLSQERQHLAVMPPGTPKPAELEGLSVFQVVTDALTPLLAPTTPPFQEKEVQEPPSLHGWPDDASYNDRNYPATHNMSLIREYLIEVFRRLDESSATMMMSSMLTIYSVEQVCSELITPTLWQVGQLWANGQISVAIEHFASNFFRALLTNLFHVTPSPREGPLTISCCAPGEPHEIAALMLALFLRRQHIRVAYLGQSIEVSGLLHTIRKLSPALVCISLTMPDYLPALTRLATQMQQLPAPRPIFSFGGQVFAHYSHAIPQIPGVHLNGDLKDIVAQLHHMVITCSENKN